MSFGIPVRNGLGVGLLASTSLSTRRGSSTPSGPSLELNFLTGTLDPRVTFSRTTTATFVGSNGLIQTAAINAARFDYDPVTLQPRGILIEDQKVNLLLQSENFATTWASVGATITTNTTVAPDGATTGDTIAASTTGSYVSQAVVYTGNSDKPYSVFVKAGTSTVTRLVLRDTTTSVNRGGVNLTWTAGVPAGVATEGTLQGIDAYPNGWYRVRMLAVGVVATNVNQFRFSPDTVVGTNNTIFWGAQTENGTISSSYIPTAASQVTRAADIATMTGTNFSSWYNAAESSMLAVFSSFVLSPPSSVYAISNGTSGNRWQTVITSGPLAISHSLNATTLQATINVGTYAPNTIFKSAFGVKLNSVQAAVNGVLGTEDTLANMPTVDRINIGSAQTNNLQLIGHIRSLTYYPTRLTNAELQALST